MFSPTVRLFLPHEERTETFSFHDFLKAPLLSDGPILSDGPLLSDEPLLSDGSLLSGEPLPSGFSRKGKN